jgi:hypothetical protein
LAFGIAPGMPLKGPGLYYCIYVQPYTFPALGHAL